MLDLNPRIKDGKPACRCGVFLEAVAAVDNLAPGVELPDPENPLHAPGPGENVQRSIVATIRDLQHRVLRLECATEGHPLAEDY